MSTFRHPLLAHLLERVLGFSLQAEDGAENEGTAAARLLRNQFNFSERGAQTSYFAPKERSISTETPPTAETSGACSSWEIYDSYLQDQRQQRQQVGGR